MSDIKISVETTIAPGVDEEITIIRVDGVIDTMTATELEKVANSLLGQKRYNIIIDLGGVDYISSAGWGIFISNIREIRLNNGDIKLARMIPNVYEIFELLEFDSILKAFDNIEKAKNDFVWNLAETRPGTGILEPRSVPVTDKISIDSGGAGQLSKPSISVGENTAIKPEKNGIDTNTAPASQIDAPPPKMSPAKHVAPGKARRLEDAIMDLVGKDPFLSVGEIRQAISKEFPGAGTIKTWWTLRQLGLGSKKKRFYFARTRRFSK